jgi:hypothetical protein
VHLLPIGFSQTFPPMNLFLNLSCLVANVVELLKKRDEQMKEIDNAEANYKYEK